MPDNAVRPHTASEIYALSQGEPCGGPLECHYCAAPCTDTLKHGEYVHPLTGRPVGGGLRKRPGNPYVCRGCWLWRRPKLTASFIGGGRKDGTSPKRHGWVVTPAGAWAVGDSCGPRLYARLLAPPRLFFLSLLEGPAPPDNLLQACAANDLPEVKAQTPLAFTLNNIPHAYNVYELEQAALHGGQGREPGVQTLLRLLGAVPKELVRNVAVDVETEKSKEGGRPPKKEEVRLADARRTVTPTKPPVPNVRKPA